MKVTSMEYSTKRFKYNQNVLKSVNRSFRRCINFHKNNSFFVWKKTPDLHISFSASAACKARSNRSISQVPYDDRLAHKEKPYKDKVSTNQLNRS